LSLLPDHLYPARCSRESAGRPLQTSAAAQSTRFSAVREPAGPPGDQMDHEHKDSCPRDRGEPGGEVRTNSTCRSTIPRLAASCRHRSAHEAASSRIRTCWRARLPPQAPVAVQPVQAAAAVARQASDCLTHSLWHLLCPCDTSSGAHITGSLRRQPSSALPSRTSTIRNL